MIHLKYRYISKNIFVSPILLSESLAQYKLDKNCIRSKRFGVKYFSVNITSRPQIEKNIV